MFKSERRSVARSVLKLSTPAGALVAQVVPDSAAEHAGIKEGDVILKYNGTPITDAGALSARVSGAAPGEKATLEIRRNGKPMSVTATIGSASTEPPPGTARARRRHRISG